MHAKKEIIHGTITGFYDWDRYVRTGDFRPFYEIPRQKIKYIHKHTGQKITINFAFGTASVGFIIDFIESENELRKLRNKLKRPNSLSGNTTQNPDTVSTESYLTISRSQITRGPHDILTNVHFDAEAVTASSQLDYTLGALSKYAKFSQAMLLDIFSIIDNNLDRQKNHMEKLNCDLLNGAPGIIKNLQRNIVIINIHQEFGAVLRWISYLVTANRSQEAILWCDLIPLDAGEYYLTHQKLAIELIMQLQTKNTTDKLILYLDENQVTLSCQEALFHFAYNIAKYTKDSSNSASVLTILSELSNTPSDKTNFSTDFISEQYLLIEQARIIKMLQNELSELKKSKSVTQNTASLLENLGLFGQSTQETDRSQTKAKNPDYSSFDNPVL